ncbi:MAG TPA: insulinase family protein, partial [Myxococcaceae bacterium]
IWVPANTVLTIAGDIDLVEAEAATRRWFDGWRPGGRPPVAPTKKSDRAADAPVPVVTTARPGARQITLEIACAVPLADPTDLVATNIVGNRSATRLNQTSRLVLGATYGFQHQIRIVGGQGEIRVHGALEERALARILALARTQTAGLGQAPSPEDLSRYVWREGIQSSARLERATSLGRAIADLRLASLPAETYERYPELLKALRAEDVARAGEACRRTAVISLLGDPAALDRAIKATGG